MSTMDWKKESEGNFPVFPDGTYKVRIHSVKRVTAKNKGTAGLQWIATVILPEDHNGRMISTTTWLVEGSLFRTANLVESCGLTGMPTMDTNSEAFLKVCQECIGRTSYWRNVQRDFEGRKNNNIVDYQPDPDQSMVEFASDEDVPEFVR